MGIDVSKFRRSGVLPHPVLLFRTVDDTYSWPLNFPQTVYRETNHRTSDCALG